MRTHNIIDILELSQPVLWILFNFKVGRVHSCSLDKPIFQGPLQWGPLSRRRVVIDWVPVRDSEVWVFYIHKDGYTAAGPTPFQSQENAPDYIDTNPKSWGVKIGRHGLINCHKDGISFLQRCKVQ
jgi:hypothetical protein